LVNSPKGTKLLDKKLRLNFPLEEGFATTWAYFPLGDFFSPPFIRYTLPDNRICDLGCPLWLVDVALLHHRRRHLICHSYWQTLRQVVLETKILLHLAVGKIRY